MGTMFNIVNRQEEWCGGWWVMGGWVGGDLLVPAAPSAAIILLPSRKIIRRRRSPRVRGTIGAPEATRETIEKGGPFVAPEGRPEVLPRVGRSDT